MHSTAFTYEWSATTKDQYYKSGTQAETSKPCYFNYDPNGPGQPIIQSWPFPPQTPACPGTSPCPTSPTIPAAIGQKLTVTVGPLAGCSPTTGPCPTSQDGTYADGFRLQFQSRSDTWQLVIANSDAESPSQSYAIGTAPTLGAWTFLVGVYDAGSKTAYLYVNGILAGSTGVSSTFDANGPFEMGHGMYTDANSNTTQNYYLAGNLSQVQAWTSALNATQVQALYQHGR